MIPTPPMIVFSDLDGTLLDHESYSHAPADPALARLRALGIPLVLASSKTAAEIAPLRHALGMDHVPAIVENGAGLLPPADPVADPQAVTDTGAAPGAPDPGYLRLRAALEQVDADLLGHFVGFGDMGPAGIARATGLAGPAAALAAQRQYSEPGIWSGSAAQRERFLGALAALGVHAREGGRFLTLSFGATKADQMAAITAGFNAPPSVALGDAPNDVELLETADLGVIIPNPARAPLPRLAGEDAGRIRRADAPGPEGWNRAMLAILRERGLNDDKKEKTGG